MRIFPSWVCLIEDGNLILGILSTNIRDVGRFFSLSKSTTKRGDGNSNEDRDDRDDDQHFHKGEALFVGEFLQHNKILLFVSFYIVPRGVVARK